MQSLAGAAKANEVFRKSKYGYLRRGRKPELDTFLSYMGEGTIKAIEKGILSGFRIDLSEISRENFGVKSRKSKYEYLRQGRKPGLDTYLHCMEKGVTLHKEILSGFRIDLSDTLYEDCKVKSSSRPSLDESGLRGTPQFRHAETSAALTLPSLLFFHAPLSGHASNTRSRLPFLNHSVYQTLAL
ncbi:hypothetical protein EJ08DRAFT_485313 [Tothia fuscella]|uniref:Uncharacterized protein n=1 Tax=Tothia fuscella TaxID=1048955 RepID=A0A9P4NHT1_9PEZI|nr:hypothetical protein EJ08DRAFT_485313 [Tothia fuscella]